MSIKIGRRPDIKCIFDSSLNLEETHLSEGFHDGFAQGLLLGLKQGTEVGLNHGFQVGEELGFYRGCVDVWSSIIRVGGDCFSARVRKKINQLGELIEKYPTLDPENEEAQEIIMAFRLQFRAISATLGVDLEYDGYSKSSDVEEIDF